MILIYGITLLVSGSFLEVYYYYYRFLADGTAWWLSLIIGIGLTAMLNAFFVVNRRALWFIAALLICYSIVSTSAGQSMSLTEKQVQETVEVNNTQIKLLQDQVDRKKERYTAVEEMMDNSISSFEEMWEWRNTTDKYETELSELDSQITNLQERIAKLNNPVVELQEDKNNIYYFYHNLFGTSVKWSQFILQTVLSAFIASMAPIGIILIKSKKKKENKLLEERRINTMFHDMIKKWVAISFAPIKANGKSIIVSKNVFNQYMQKRSVSFSNEAYEKIKSLAIKAGVIDTNGNILIKNEEEAISLIWKEYIHF